MDISLLILAVVASSALFYVAYVNRPIQTYQAKFTLPATIDEVCAALVPVPGQAYLFDEIRVEAVDDAATDLSIRFPNGSETRMRILVDRRPQELVCESIARKNASAPWGDRIFCREAVRSLGTDSEVTIEILIERGPLSAGFFKRLFYPATIRFARFTLQTEIARRRKLAPRGPWGRADGARPPS